MDEKEEEGKPIIAVYWSAPEAIGERREHIFRIKLLIIKLRIVSIPRFFNKVSYSRCAPMYGKCRLLRWIDKNLI